jgi:tRNA-splicing ligase RtcB (3'-phosphate/5'-hydroxy nucleic acid ligase)
MEIQGKYNTATIHTDNIDEASLSQIYNMLNNPCFADTKIAIMPDVHLGKGSVVGFTMTFNS